MHDFPPFPGFRSEAFRFFRNLAQNNERDWFKPRKTIYEDEVLWPLKCLVVDVARQAGALGLPLTGDPKHSLFRIYRDTRFSKNKQPYKTHAGAVLSRTGSRKEQGIVYIHVEPGAAFLAAGFYHPATPLVQAWRARIALDPSAFLDVARALEAKGLLLETTNDALKRIPRGYEELADADVADYLRWKSYLVRRDVSDEALQSPDFTQCVVQMIQDVVPLLEYGWQCDKASLM